MICLDEATASTRETRVTKTQSGDINSFNRWHDKGIQFVVFADGASSHIAEHSKIDGLTVHRMVDWIHEAINAPKHTNGTNGTSGQVIALEEVSLLTTPDIDSIAKTIHDNYTTTLSKYQFAHHRTNAFGKELLAANSLPYKGTFDIVVQLASRLFRGWTPPSYEPLSMLHHYKGRLEWVQVVTETVARFCDSAWDDDIPASKRHAMLVESVNGANAYLRQVSNETSSHVTLLKIMDSLWPATEAKPELFQDPVYVRTLPQLMLAMLTDDSVADSSDIPKQPDMMRVLYTVGDNRYVLLASSAFCF